VNKILRIRIKTIIIGVRYKKKIKLDEGRILVKR
jgi:hypothetical protein